MSFLQIYSEIENLEAVLLHTPGKELEELTPRYLGELLFDDIPWLDKIQEEHQGFADCLRSQGTQVFAYKDLLSNILEDPSQRIKVLKDFIAFHRIHSPREIEQLEAYFRSRSAVDLAGIMISGLQRKEVSRFLGLESLSNYIEGEFNYYFPPLPNLYFTRDPGAVIHQGVSLHSMRTPIRRGEAFILHEIMKYHQQFEGPEEWMDFQQGHSLEGGDLFVLSPKVILAGCSARTSSSAIEDLGRNLLGKSDGPEKFLILQIPFERAYMHLDTVFTMLDYDSFFLYPGIEDHIHCFIMTLKEKDLRIQSGMSLKQALEQCLEIPAVRLIRSGGESRTTAAREQWNDSTNTLAVSPGKVLCYNRNQRSNEALDKAGIEVLPIEGSELVRGRGGPRCMSMPLRRRRIIH